MARADGAVLVGLVLLLAVAESAVLLDLVVPGDVGLILAGAAAAQNGTSLTALIVCAALGAFVGDSFMFMVGRRYGADLVGRWELTRRHLDEPLHRAERYYERRGGVTVALARWVGALRAVVPAVAGSAGLPPRRFAAWLLPSALAWAATILWLGHRFGDDAARAFDRASWLVSTVVVILVLVVMWLRHRGRARRRSVTSEPAEPSESA